ncbi:MAG TPA: helical backbone metal receptor [Acidimicrobiales bacterium]
MRPTRSAAPLLFVLLVLAAACADGAGTQRPASGGTSDSPTASPTAAAFPVTVTDDDGVRVTIPAAPERIVTFAPSATEIVFALGLGDRLVGVAGPFDDHPPAAREVEQVGGAGDFGVDPNVEQVVALQPDLFLTIKGGDQWKRRLRDLGVPVVTLDATDLDDLIDDIRAVGRLTGAAEEADAVAEEMRAQADEVARALAARKAVTCFYETFYPPLYTVGPGTFIFDLLESAGCDPVTAGAEQQYPEWSVEDLVRRSPHVYLVSSESGASARAVAGRAGFDAVSAVADGRVVPVDADLVERPGPRVVQGLRLLAEALHPDAFA